MNLTEKQKSALNALVEGKNVFLTGEAGTGKSFVIKKFIKWCEENNRDVIIAAPTGVSALNVGGSTIHSTFKVPITVLNPADSIPEPAPWVKKADVIIIDEISMCRIDVFDYVIRSIFYAEHTEYLDVFKVRSEHESIKLGKQIVVVGDFFQLPPVITGKDRKVLYSNYHGQDNVRNGYAFMSTLWDAIGFETHYLDEVVRQADSAFSDALKKVRFNNSEGIEWIKEHSSKVKFDKATTLCPKRKKVAAINEASLKSLPGEIIEYVSKNEGCVEEIDRPTDKTLKLKVGARVMCVANDLNKRYVNGSIGYITELGDDHIKIRLETEAQDSKEIEIHRHTWPILAYTKDKEIDADGVRFHPKEIGWFTQFPVKLAYAVTIHKSQGATIKSCVNLDPDCFTTGQLYTALTRISNIENLYIDGKVSSKKGMTDKVVINFYEKILGNPNETFIDDEKLESDEDKAEGISVNEAHQSGRGGSRKGAGRKRIHNNQVLKPKSFRLTDEEEILIRKYLNQIRSEKSLAV